MLYTHGIILAKAEKMWKSDSKLGSNKTEGCAEEKIHAKWGEERDTLSATLCSAGPTGQPTGRDLLEHTERNVLMQRCRWAFVEIKDTQW